MRISGALLLALVMAAPAAAKPSPQVSLSDVERFYRIYDAAHGHPTAEQLDRDYLAPGSSGLHEFARLRNVTGARIADTIARHPETYENARKCLATLPRVKRRVDAALARLDRLYPQARSAPITLLIGRGRPVGITDPSGVSIGVEALCAADFMNPDPEERFVHVLAHEYGHIQQSGPLQALEPGQPGATVLAMSLMEGAGEFTAELISGDIANHEHLALVKGHEKQIGEAFLADQDKTDLSKWLYNSKGTVQDPGDLGYWVGWRIVRSYYGHARDKRQALADIYAMKDPKAFLARSGWRPGD